MELSVACISKISFIRKSGYGIPAQDSQRKISLTFLTASTVDKGQKVPVLALVCLWLKQSSKARMEQLALAISQVEVPVLRSAFTVTELSFYFAIIESGEEHSATINFITERKVRDGTFKMRRSKQGVWFWQQPCCSLEQN